MEPISRNSVEHYAGLVPGEIRGRVAALAGDRDLAVALVIYFAPDRRVQLAEIAVALGLTVMAVCPPLGALLRAGMVIRTVAHLADGCDETQAWYELSPASRRLIDALLAVSYPTGSPA